MVIAMPRIRLRRWLVAVLCASAAAIGSTLGSIPVASGDIPPGPGPIAFGAFVGPRSGESDQSAVLRMESNAGRPMDVVREFVLWDTPFPDAFHTWLRDTGHTMILSVKSRRVNGTVIPWANLVAAQPGSPLYTDIERWADRIRDYGVPIYFAFNHEPESSASFPMGEAPDFIAAWRKVHDIFVARGVTNAKFVWIMTDYAFWVGSQARNDASKWFPGDAYLDAMGIDAYNWYHCRTGINTAWKSLEQIIRPFRDFGANHPDKELWLTEWASTEDPLVPGRKAQFYADAQALFKRADYAQFEGISYFDTRGQGACTWYPDSTPSSLAAFRTMATDEFYGGSITPPPPEPSEIAFVASASSNGNRTVHTVQVPASVQAGDTLLLFFTANQNPATTTPPGGWTELRAVDPSGLRGRVWTRTATGSDAGSTVTVGNSVIVKADLTVAAYRALDATPIDVHAFAVETATTSTHIAPSVTPTVSGAWVAVYWADKSSTNTTHTIPGTLTRRRTTTGSGGGHITATIADTNTGVATAPTGTFTATGTGDASRAVMYTIALRPQ